MNYLKRILLLCVLTICLGCCGPKEVCKSNYKPGDWFMYGNHGTRGYVGRYEVIEIVEQIDPDPNIEIYKVKNRDTGKEGYIAINK